VANIKQQIKRVKTNDKKRLLNASFKSSLRTAIKSVETEVANSNKATALEAFKLASKKLDKAVSKGIFHKNYASGQKSRLSNAINSIE
jgi:small subunit ribosomal protein S20